MKRIAAYYLLLIYSIAVIHPFFPIVANFASHNLKEAIHINTVHSIYGENHAQQEIAKQTGNSKDNQQNQISIQKVFDSYHVVYNSIILVDRYNFILSDNITHVNKHSLSPFYDALINPPDFI